MFLLAGELPLAAQKTIVAAILLIALVLFIGRWVRFDVVAIIVVCLLVGSRVLTPHDALIGFANPAIIVLACLFVITRALQKTGFVDTAAHGLQQLSSGSETRIFIILLLVVGLLSAIINNTAVTAMAIPMVLRCYDRLGKSPSRVYLPLAFISLVGGTMTLIGTTTNITVNSQLTRLAEDYRAAGNALADELRPIGMFEMTPVGAIFLVVSGVVLLLLGRVFLKGGAKESLFNKYKVKEFLSEVLVKANSQIVGHPIQDLHFGKDYDITIIGVVRDDRTIFSPPPTLQIRKDDVLIVQGGVENIISVRREKRLELLNEIKVEERTLRSIDVIMAEVVLLPNSSFIGQTIRSLDLRDAFGVTILAHARRGMKHFTNLADMPLRLGDTLLIQGHPSGIERLREQRNVLVLETIDRPLTNRRLPVAAAIIAAMVIGSSIPGSTLFLNCLLAVLALLATRCISLQEVYDSVDWRLLVLIGGLLPLGQAVMDARLLDPVLTFLAEHPMPATWVVAGLFVVTFFVTQVVSNIAAAGLMTPVAVQIAEGLDKSHRPFIMAVAFAASFAFLTPVGHQACTLVMGPGNYRARDYLVLGSILGFVLFVVAIWAIPWAFPFDAR